MNTVRLFAIIAIIIVVAGVTLYYESSGTTNNQSNSESKPGSIVYPTGNLAGAIEISHLDGVSGFRSPSILNMQAFVESVSGNTFADFLFGYESLGIWICEMGDFQ